ncbi:MAG: signal transduction histidine kinase/ActR/RegA family two-component response regulator [Bacteroidia bacterium]|jgi:signal transduction histidine kinase/ActR/RegA family two-component response regulator
MNRILFRMLLPLAMLVCTSSIAADLLKSAEVSVGYDISISEQKQKLAIAVSRQEKATLNNNIGILLYSCGQIEESYVFFETANTLLANAKCSKDQAIAKARLSLIDCQRGETLPNDTKLTEALFCARELNDEYIESEVLLYQGREHLHNGRYSEAFGSFFRARELKETSKDKIGLLEAYLDIADALTRIGQHSEARVNLQDALKLNSEVGNNHLLAKIYNLLAVNYLKQSNNSYANIYVLKAQKAADEVADKLELVKAYLLLSQLSTERKDYTNSNAYLKKAGGLMADKDFNNLKSDYQYHAALLALSENRADDAISLTNVIIDGEDRYKSQYDLSNAYELQTRAYHSLNDYKKAFEVSDQYARLRADNGVSGAFRQFEQLRDKSEQITTQTENVKSEAQEKIVVQKRRAADILNYSLTGGFLLLSILLIVLFRQMRVKQSSNAKLEQRNILINKQNSELRKMNTTLEESRKQAEAGSVAKSNFLAVTSHEIRTPMNGIMGMASLMLETPLDDEQKKFVETIQTSSENLLTILNDILDFSKIEAGKMSIESTLIDLDKLLEEVMIIFSKQAKDKNIQLSKFIGNAMIKQFRGDILRIRQILINLVSNAIKFTDNGYVKIIVEIDELLRAQTDDARIAKLRFSVKDDGIGISEEKQRKIFESFEQEDTSTSRKYGGIGLGLSISKKLVELMGGEIGLTSEKNIGTTFYFTLNVEIPKTLARQELTVNTIPSATQASEATVMTSGKFAELYPLRILVAEDNPFNKMFIDKLFEKFGYTDAHYAENGIEVLKKLEHETIDVILMDIQMPEMDGLEATRRILKKYGNRRPAIIALTADATDSSKSHYLDAGMDGFLSKPFKQEALQEILIAQSSKINQLA